MPALSYEVVFHKDRAYWSAVILCVCPIEMWFGLCNHRVLVRVPVSASGFPSLHMLSSMALSSILLCSTILISHDYIIILKVKTIET